MPAAAGVIAAAEGFQRHQPKWRETASAAIATMSPCIAQAGSTTAARPPAEYAAALTAAILVGNTLGARLRGHIPAAMAPRIELGVLGVATTLALAGVAR